MQTITVQERARLAARDAERRRQLLIPISAATSIGVGLYVLVLLFSGIYFGNLFSPNNLLALMAMGVALGVCACGTVSLLMAQRHRVNGAVQLFATALTIAPALGAVLTSFFSGQGLNLYGFFLYPVLVVIISLVSPPRQTIIAGSLIVVAVTSILLWAPHPQLSNDEISQIPTNIPIFAVAMGLLVAGLIAQWRSYQRTLHELSDVQVEVERAHQLDDLKDQFIRSVNHELRTPIMTILGYVDLLSQPEYSDTPEASALYVQRAQQAGKSLSVLLEQILDTRALRPDSETMQPVSVALADAIKASLVLLPTAAQPEREVQLNCPPDLVVWADPLRLQQIFINLLSNALKYSDPGTPIEVTAKPITVQMAGGKRARQLLAQPMVEIAVRDYGLGVPPEQMPLLFQRFARLPRDLESTTVGTGLGLYLCRVLTEVMGGRVGVESTGIPGEGSTFWLHLPVPQDDALHAAP